MKAVYIQAQGSFEAEAYNRLPAYSQQQADVLSFEGNQAVLARLKTFSSGLFGGSRFMLKELSFFQVAVAFPGSSGNFGLSASYFGNVAYNEKRVSLAYGRALTEGVLIGAQFNLQNHFVQKFGSVTSVGVEGGVLLQLKEGLVGGVHFAVPYDSRNSKGALERPFNCSAGLGYDVSEQLVLTAEVNKVEDLPVSFNAGVQYHINELLFARAGISSGSSIFFLGLGFKVGNARVDVVTTVHQQLGITPGLRLVLSKKEVE